MIHFLWNYLTDTFTVKKKKYINSEIDKYRQILEEYSLPKEDKVDEHSILEHDLEIFLQNNI
jgi:hypothetical protein